ncbi:ErfK/YbiS/YcfS/YnhG family protein [Rhizobium sp. PDO1-076]|uniref:L,D-transpeptidase family protein n=1 Tax=Rhizobium sp. PDO1-076 TaxID=1125979 RepID=UPI00024E392B|nr:murein L,D-transpeptidase family protein [Rhizobium sp. PDO1-076]EHS52105.1 ErfK/YbiS/YcfS/YnhG family protein [Rhizobium sp. PDO1-076]
MRWKSTALVLIFAAALAGCNDTLESATYDSPKVSNKIQQPLPARLVAEIQKKGMDRNAPIMLRIFKEEGVLEVWKAKTNNRFDKVVEYDICAWSGRLGPKVKEGDRQAPEGFYPLTPYHLNPNSKYFLAINTGFPNRFDQANGRSGSNLMIHGACSSSGCYSMTDAQILEIYAFARDAFKGGQQSIQLQAFPFRMTAENMARHRHSQHYDFWKTLKVGYDNFEVTKRPPDVNVCEKKYVFNQLTADGKGFNAQAACPPMSTPPALEMALASYNKEYDRNYAKALNKFDGKIWYDPSEAERKALVADLRKSRSHDLAFAPTGSALAAGKLLDIDDVNPTAVASATSAPAAINQLTAKPPAAGTTATAATTVAGTAQTVAPVAVAPATATAAPAGTATASAAPIAPVAPAAPSAAPAQATATAQAGQSVVPVPQPNPQMAETTVAEAPVKKKPFWKLW